MHGEGDCEKSHQRDGVWLRRLWNEPSKRRRSLWLKRPWKEPSERRRWLRRPWKEPSERRRWLTKLWKEPSKRRSMAWETVKEPSKTRRMAKETVKRAIQETVYGEGDSEKSHQGHDVWRNKIKVQLGLCILRKSAHWTERKSLVVLLAKPTESGDAQDLGILKFLIWYYGFKYWLRENEITTRKRLVEISIRPWILFNSWE